MTTLNSIYAEAERLGYPITDHEAEECLVFIGRGMTTEAAIEEHAKLWFETQEVSG